MKRAKDKSEGVPVFFFFFFFQYKGWNYKVISLKGNKRSFFRRFPVNTNAFILQFPVFYQKLSCNVNGRLDTTSLFIVGRLLWVCIKHTTKKTKTDQGCCAKCNFLKLFATLVLKRVTLIRQSVRFYAFGSSCACECKPPHFCQGFV